MQHGMQAWREPLSTAGENQVATCCDREGATGGFRGLFDQSKVLEFLWQKRAGRPYSTPMEGDGAIVMHIVCKGCRREVKMPSPEFNFRFGRYGVSLASRLRCTECGHKGADVVGVWHPEVPGPARGAR